MSKKLWLAALAAFVVFMLFSIIVEGLLLASFIQNI